MSYEFYKVVHVTSVIAAFVALGGLLFYSAAGQKTEWRPQKKLLSIVHGVALLLALVSGFGLLARLNLPWDFTAWPMAKVILWLAVGATPVLLYRTAVKVGVGVWVGILCAAGALGAILAVTKPF